MSKPRRIDLTIDTSQEISPKGVAELMSPRYGAFSDEESSIQHLSINSNDHSEEENTLKKKMGEMRFEELQEMILQQQKEVDITQQKINRLPEVLRGLSIGDYDKLEEEVLKQNSEIKKTPKPNTRNSKASPLQVLTKEKTQ